MTNSNTLLPTSAQPDAEGFRRYRIAPSGIGSAAASSISTCSGAMTTSCLIVCAAR